LLNKRLSETKEESVHVLMGDLCDGVGQWKVYWRRKLREPELRQLDQLKQMSSGVQFILKKKDTRVREACSQEGLLLTLATNWYLTGLFTQVLYRSPLCLWQMFSFGSLLQNRVCTQKFLLRMHMIGIGQRNCSFCHSSTDDAAHLF